MTFDEVRFIDLELIDHSLRGFFGGFEYVPPRNGTDFPAQGAYGFLVPYKNNLYGPGGSGNGLHGNFVRLTMSWFNDLAQFQFHNRTGTGNSDARRLDTALKYSSEAELVDNCVQVLNLALVDADLVGFKGGFAAWGFGYLVPGWTAEGNAASGGKVARVDLSTFASASVTVLDLSSYLSSPGSLHARPLGFVGGFKWVVGGESLLPPHSVAYLTNPALYSIGSIVPNNGPAYSGGIASNFSIWPPLPTGLVFDTSLGVISGSPSEMTAWGWYTIVVANSAGSESVQLYLKVGQGNFMYLAPNFKGKVARINLKSFSMDAVSSLDLPTAAKASGLTGFSGAFAMRFQGSAFFVPSHDGGVYSGKIVRVSLEDFSTVTLLDLETISPALKGFSGGTAATLFGKEWGYLSPEYGEPPYTATGQLVRIDLAEFPKPESVKVMDMRAVDPELQGFSGIFANPPFVFVIPSYNKDYYGKFVRISMLKCAENFEVSCAINEDLRMDALEVRNLRDVDGRLRGFSGGFFSATLNAGILAPFYNGTHYHGLVPKVDLSAVAFTEASVEMIDVSEHDPACVGFRGGFESGGLGYLVPYKNSKLTRFSIRDFDLGSVATLNVAEVDPNLKGGFVQGIAEGTFGYLLPHFRGDGTGMADTVVRFTISTFVASDCVLLRLTSGGDEDLQGFMGGFHFMKISQTVNYVENEEPSLISAGIGLADVDSFMIHSALIVLVPASMVGDVLGLDGSAVLSGQLGVSSKVAYMPNEFSIVGSWDSETGILKLEGSATKAEYEATLRRITFQCISEDPPTIIRVVSFYIEGNLVYKTAVTVEGTDDFVTAKSVQSKSLYVAGAGNSAAIFGGLVLFDMEAELRRAMSDLASLAAGGDAMAKAQYNQLLMQMAMKGTEEFKLDFASVTIETGYDMYADRLMLDVNPESCPFVNETCGGDWMNCGINSTFIVPTGQLLMMGPAPISVFQAALRCVEFKSSSTSLETRGFSVAINDGSGTQKVAETEVASVTRQVGIMAAEVQPVSSEAGAAGSFKVVMTDAPKHPVLFAMTSSDATEGVASPTFAVLSQANWEEGVQVTVDGQKDDLIDGDVAYTVTIAPLSTKDEDYLRHPAVEVSMINLDNPINKVRVNAAPTTGLRTSEGGQMAEFVISLTSWHSTFDSLVVTAVTTRPDEGKLIVLGAAVNASQVEGQESVSVSYSADNYTVPTIVASRGEDDLSQDGLQYYQVKLSARLKLKSVDGAAPQEVSISTSRMTTTVVCANEDNDVAGVLVEKVDDCTNTSEAGEYCEFLVSLSSLPTSNVTFVVASSNTTEGAVTQGAQFFIKAAEFQTQKIVVVTGVDDEAFDKNQYYDLTFRTVSRDYAYDGAEIVIPMCNKDNDIAELEVTQNGQRFSGIGDPVSETGAKANFEVSLPAGTPPNHAVTIDISSGNTGEGRLAPHRLVFTEMNYDQPQTVVITGQDDTEQDGDEGFKVTLNTHSTEDKFDLIEWYFFMENQDDDKLTLEPATCTVLEGAAVPGPGRCAVALHLNDAQLKEFSWRPEFSELIWDVRVASDTDAGIVSIGSTPTAPEAGALPSRHVQFVWTASNYLQTQYLYVDAIDNSVAAADVTWQLALTGSIKMRKTGGGAAAADEIVTKPTTNTTFGGISVNDDVPGVIVSETWGEKRMVGEVIALGIPPVSAARTSENGTLSSGFTIVLASQPLYPVTIPIASTDTQEGATCFDRALCRTTFPNAAPLVFKATDWNVPRDVVVRGLDDWVFDGDLRYQMQLGPAVSADARYAEMYHEREFINEDDDSVGIVAEVKGDLDRSSELGKTAYVVVRLLSRPKAPLLFSMSSRTPTEGVPEPSIFVLSMENWDVGVEVSVAGQPDAMPDLDISYEVAATAITTTDVDYSTMTTPLVVNIVNEADAADSLSIMLSSYDCATSEADAATVTDTYTGAGGSTCIVGFRANQWHVGDGAYRSILVTVKTTNAAEGLLVPTTVKATSAGGGAADGAPPSDWGASATQYEVLAGSTPQPSLAFTVDASNWEQGAWFAVVGVDDALVDGQVGLDVQLTAVLTAELPADVTRVNPINLRALGYFGGSLAVAGGTVSAGELVQKELGQLASLRATNWDDDDGDQGLLTSTSCSAAKATTLDDEKYGALPDLGHAHCTFKVSLQTEPVLPVTVVVYREVSESAFTAGADIPTAVAGAMEPVDLFSTAGTHAAVGHGRRLAGAAEHELARRLGSPAASTQMVFNKGNWMVPQETRVTPPTGVAFINPDPKTECLVRVGPSESSDPAYGPPHNAFDAVFSMRTLVDEFVVENKILDAQRVMLEIDGKRLANLADGGGVDESGHSVTFTVRLVNKPVSDVTITFASSNEQEIAVTSQAGTRAHVFRPSDFHAGFPEDGSGKAIITVTGVDDAQMDGPQVAGVSFSVASADPNYQGVDGFSIFFTNYDNDLTAIDLGEGRAPGTGLLAPAAEQQVALAGDDADAMTLQCRTSEGGGSCTVNVTLANLPPHAGADGTDWQYSVSASSSTPTEGIVSPASFLLDSSRSSQTVTITGVDELIDDGEKLYTVSMVPVLHFKHAAHDAVNGAATLSASRDRTVLTAMRDAAVRVRNVDDDTAGLEVSRCTASLRCHDDTQQQKSGVPFFDSEGQREALINARAGAWPETCYVAGCLYKRNQYQAIIDASLHGNVTDEGGRNPVRLSVKLRTQPLTDIWVPCSTDDLTEGVALPPRYTDRLVMNPQLAKVVFTNKTDLVKSYMDINEPLSWDWAKLWDDPHSDKRLVNAPSANSKIGLKTEQTLTGQCRLTFTPENWDQPQTVTIVGVDDDVFDYNVTYHATFGPSRPAEGAAQDLLDGSTGLTMQKTMVNYDDDTTGIIVTTLHDTLKNPTDAGFWLNHTSEDSVKVGRLKIRLLSQPKSAVLFTATTSKTKEAVVAPGILAFTADDWSNAQALQVGGVDDDVSDGDQYYVVVLKTLYTADPDYSSRLSGMFSASVPFVNEDDSTDRSESECVLGYYGFNNVSTTDPLFCRPCPKGTWSMTTVNVRTPYQCTKCPQGTKGTAFGSASATSVATSDAEDAVGCRPCLPGSFQDIAGLITCEPCAADLFCPIGTVYPLRMNASLKEEGTFHWWTAPETVEFERDFSWSIGPYSGDMHVTEVSH
jgi:hypothetical protein